MEKALILEALKAISDFAPRPGENPSQDSAEIDRAISQTSAFVVLRRDFAEVIAAKNKELEKARSAREFAELNSAGLTARLNNVEVEIKRELVDRGLSGESLPAAAEAAGCPCRIEGAGQAVGDYSGRELATILAFHARRDREIMKAEFEAIREEKADLLNVIASVRDELGSTNGQLEAAKKKIIEFEGRGQGDEDHHARSEELLDEAIREEAMAAPKEAPAPVVEDAEIVELRAKVAEAAKLKRVSVLDIASGLGLSQFEQLSKEQLQAALETLAVETPVVELKTETVNTAERIPVPGEETGPPVIVSEPQKAPAPPVVEDDELLELREQVLEAAALKKIEPGDIAGQAGFSLFEQLNHEHLREALARLSPPSAAEAEPPIVVLEEKPTEVVEPE